jgi:hypothetical protein
MCFCCTMHVNYTPIVASIFLCSSSVLSSSYTEDSCSMASGDASHALSLYRAAVAATAGDCLGPHTHQPSNKKMMKMSSEEWRGRCFHEAAADGCLPCVIQWVNNGVDVAWQSPNSQFTASDWIDYELTHNSGDAAKVQRLTFCKDFLATRTPQ